VGRIPSILIVDDTLDDVLSFRRAFTRTGVTNPIHWVKSGREAVQYLRGDTPFENRMKSPIPSVILLDLEMPDANGWAVLRWIRNRFPSGALLVVVLTRLEELRQIHRAYSMGANSFLTKPGNAEELQELIRIFQGYWLLANPLPEEPHANGAADKEFYAAK
jgi:CheY-like chemotaxis protein